MYIHKRPICKNCRHYVPPEKFQPLKFKPLPSVASMNPRCSHPQLLDVVTGEPDSCGLLRIRMCGPEGRFFETPVTGELRVSGDHDGLKDLVPGGFKCLALLGAASVLGAALMLAGIVFL